jgi:hypothetical protein
MTKTFPKSRICVVDVYPAFEKGLRIAMDFVSKHNIQMNSADGRRVLFAYCIKAIEAEYKNTQSSFPKVMCIGKKAISKRVSLFIDNYFETILSQMPIPYCGKIDLNSPDLESAAENSLKHYRPQRKYVDLAARLKIKN